jgi:hypothetical protein
MRGDNGKGAEAPDRLARILRQAAKQIVELGRRQDRYLFARHLGAVDPGRRVARDHFEPGRAL